MRSQLLHADQARTHGDCADAVGAGGFHVIGMIADQRHAAAAAKPALLPRVPQSDTNQACPIAFPAANIWSLTTCTAGGAFISHTPQLVVTT